MTTRAALVPASHGTSDHAGRRAVSALVGALADGVRDRDDGPLVAGCFVDVQQPDVPTALRSLPPETPAVVVPLLLSAGYHVHVDLQKAARGAARPPRGSGRPVTVAGALGPDRRLAEVQARRLAEIGLRSDDVVVMAAAGSSDAEAVVDCERAGRLLGARIGRPVTVGYLSASRPPLACAVASARVNSAGRRVVLSTYLLAPGYFATLTERVGADAVSRPLLVDGEPTPDELLGVVEDRYLAAEAGGAEDQSVAPSRRTLRIPHRCTA